MEVIIENPETGETQVLTKDANGKFPPFKLPWRVKGTTAAIQQQTVIQNRIASIQSMVAVYATKMGLPVAEFLDAARWLLDKDCPFCQVATEVLRRVSELGDEKAMDLVRRVKIAKDTNNATALAIIKLEVKSALDRPR